MTTSCILSHEFVWHKDDFSSDSDSKAYPVVVFVHGGSFAVGSGRDYPTQGFIDAFVRRGIAVVTLQYRLGPLGTPTIPAVLRRSGGGG